MSPSSSGKKLCCRLTGECLARAPWARGVEGGTVLLAGLEWSLGIWLNIKGKETLEGWRTLRTSDLHLKHESYYTISSSSP